MSDLIATVPFMLLLTTGTYLLGSYIYNKSGISILHPILISIITIICVLKWFDIPYEVYAEKSSLIDFLLGPSVVALGYTLYEQINYIKGKVITILTSVLVGSFVGVISVITICRLMGVEECIIASLEPKSVTTPIAVSLASRSGGIPALTAIVVVVCGIFGSITGPFVLRTMHIRSKVAQGLAMGAAAHGLGTARAIEMGAVEGAISGLSIGLMGIMTSLLIPLLEMLFR